MTDTRNLFRDVVERKPCDWDDIESFTPTQAQKEAMAKMELVFVDDIDSPLDDMFVSYEDDEELAFELENVLVRGEDDEGVSLYYSNNEGFQYARYAAKVLWDYKDFLEFRKNMRRNRL